MLDIDEWARLSLERRRKTAGCSADEPASERSERRRLKENKPWAGGREAGCDPDVERASRTREIRRGVGEGWVLRCSAGEDTPRELLWPMVVRETRGPVAKAGYE